MNVPSQNNNTSLNIERVLEHIQSLYVKEFIGRNSEVCAKPQWTYLSALRGFFASSTIYSILACPPPLQFTQWMYSFLLWNSYHCTRGASISLTTGIAGLERLPIVVHLECLVTIWNIVKVLVAVRITVWIAVPH